MHGSPALLYLHQQAAVHGSLGSGLLSLAVTALLTAAALALVTYGGRWRAGRQITREAEAYLRGGKAST